MANTAMNDFMPIILEMMKNPPDANTPLPLANHFKTAIGVTIPFLAFSFIALGLRLHTRLRIVHEPGWDDALVTIAAFLNLVGQTAFLGGVKSGIGQHLIYILGTLPNAMEWFYVANAAYTSTTVCIKLSLLCQYLRLFRKSYRRTITLVILAVVVLWGSVFSFMAWVPCFPISGFWNKTMVPPAKCYAFGYRTTQEAKNTLFAFAGSNMLLDVLVFLIPLTEYSRPYLNRKQVMAMTGLFGVGLIVVLMAILRLWSGLKYNNRGVLMYDYSFWLPEVLIFSCLEVDFAIICASMPVFWPTVLAAWNQISVTKEVIVTVEHRDPTNIGDLEMERPIARQSNESTEGLVTALPYYRQQSYSTNVLPAPRMMQVRPLEETVRISWGGTALNK